MGRNFTEEEGDRFRKIPLPERVIETNISGGDIRKDWTKHILETAE